MREIVPQILWIGHALDVRSSRAILEAQIRAVVDVAYEEAPAQLPREIVYVRVPLVDGAGNDPAFIRLAIATLVQLLGAEIPTLLGCGAGMSRAPAIAAMSLAKFNNEPPDEVLQSIAHSGAHDVSPLLWGDLVKACSE